MNRDKVRAIRESLKIALQMVETEHNVAVEIGSARFSDNNANFKIEFADIGKDGEVFNQEAEDFKRLATSYGLKASDLGREFDHMGERFKITGLSTRKRKYPIMAERVIDGAKFKMPVDMVRFSLEKMEKVS